MFCQDYNIVQSPLIPEDLGEVFSPRRAVQPWDRAQRCGSISIIEFIHMDEALSEHSQL